MTNSFKTTLLAAALAVSLTSCSKTEKAETASADEDTAVLVQTGETVADKADDVEGNLWGDFDNLDFDVPEIKLSNPFDGLSLRGNDQYGYYSLGENILFETDKATLSSKGQQGLEEVVKNMEERYSGAKVRVYGFADTTGPAGYNKALSMERANTVKDWLSTKGISSERLSIQAMGEKNPIPGSNADSRRVVIVAKKS